MHTSTAIVYSLVDSCVENIDYLNLAARFHGKIKKVKDDRVQQYYLLLFTFDNQFGVNHLKGGD